jgi:hypothetical protein
VNRERCANRLIADAVGTLCRLFRKVAITRRVGRVAMNFKIGQFDLPAR